MNKTLPVGDILALLLTTLIGFVTHGEGNLSFIPRFLAAFIPIAIAWLLLAPWFGLFQPETTSNVKQFWRVPLAMIFIAPLAVTVRGALLATDVIPIFVLVFGVTSAFGLLLWRGLYFLFKPKP
jgi:hypothetical protein